jgi:molybdate/tungstate transport system permease protein
VKRHNFLFDLIFSLAGTLLIIFVLLPLLLTVFGTPIQDYQKTLTDPQVLSVIVVTFLAGLVATLMAFLFGLPLAYILERKKFFGKRIIQSIIDLPIVIPHTAAGIALLMVFGSHGIIGNLFAAMSIHFVDSFTGIVVAMFFVSSPFFINSCREAVHSVDKDLELTACIDGANAWQVFYQVTLPLAWRGVTSGAIMMWARGISEFGAVVILAYNPKIISTLLFERFEGYGFNAARPIAAILIIVVLFVFIFVRSLFLPSKSD